MSIRQEKEGTLWKGRAERRSIERPHYLRDSSRMSDDPFSDILRFAKAETLVTGGFTAAGD